MIISIDLGSNTIRVALIEYINDICFVRKSFERIVGSAIGLSKNGLISDEAKARIFNALKEAKEEFDFENLQHIAVATAAFRIAKNSDDIFKEIVFKFGINFRVISGESEAKFINLGVTNALDRLKIPKKDSLFIDLGGASSEISNRHKFRSFEFGIITFFEKFKEIKAMQENAKYIVSEAKEFIKELNPSKIVLTSGVATTMASLKLGITYNEYDAQKINGTNLHIHDFATLKEWLITLDNQTATKFVGENRQMLVVAGMTILHEMLKDFTAEIITIDDGLREGIAVSYFKGSFDTILKTKE